MRKAKITVIGAGSVGATIAQRLAEGGLGDVVLLDTVESLSRGRALDLAQAAPLVPHDGRVIGTADEAETVGSDLVVVAAGLARRPGMSRDELLDVNGRVVADCVTRVVRGSRDAVLIVVTNPVEVMCEAAFAASGFPRERVLGMAGVLDSARMRALLAAELGVSSASVFALVLGGHGDTMVPLPRLASVSGIPVGALLPAEKLDAIVQRTVAGGGEIVGLVGSSATFAPAAGVWQMAEAIVHDRKKVLPCAVRLAGEYGLRDVFIGVPCRLGRGGMEGVFTVPLEPDEAARLQASAADIARQTAKLPADLGVV